MADQPMPADATQRYAELERAYVEERWSSVRISGRALLQSLEQSDEPMAGSLANRVRVLMGHTHLYGLGEPEVAEDYYRAVLASNAESELRQIAADGLQRCQQPAAGSGEGGAAAGAAGSATLEPTGSGAAAGVDPFLAAVSAVPGAAARPTSEPAMPWLQDLSPQDTAAGVPSTPEQGSGTAEGGGALAPRLEVEVVEEPELLEVAQADPGLAEELELELKRIRERRASRTAEAAGSSSTPSEATSPTGPPTEAGRAEDQSRHDPLAAAIAAAAAEVTASGASSEEPAGEGEGTAMAAATPQLVAPTIHEEADAIAEPAPVPPQNPARVAPDLSSEDPELVAGLLRVVLKG